MKHFLILTLLFLIQDGLAVQSSDTLLYEAGEMRLTKNLITNKFTLTQTEREKTYDNLNFAKPIARFFQVLDAENNLFYIDRNWVTLEYVNDRRIACKTVPHYTTHIESDSNEFKIYEDETSYDHGNKIPAEVTLTISKDRAEKVYFINGQTEFKFNANFDAEITTTNPRTVIIYNKGKYFTHNNPNQKYDAIDFKNHRYFLKTERDGLYGILGVVEPKYMHISNFTYYLAEATLPDGTQFYIDTDGNEYKLVKGKKKIQKSRRL